MDPTTADLEGQRLGPYELGARLGAGGMGVVYKARDSRLDRDVAIKVLPAHVSDREAIERFKQEARVIAALNHPHICTLHDIGEAPSADFANSEPIHFLVMEFVEGVTLERAGPLPLEAARVASIAAQVADALDAAHRRGIVHRDIKPLNIMMTPDGHVKVLDFGIAKLDRHGDDSSLHGRTTLKTRPGVIIGTPLYMSPEQACGGPVTAASDIFSLGVVLYRLLTSRHPFALDERGIHVQTLVEALLVHAPPSLHAHNPCVAPQLDALVQRMLEKDASRRPNAAEVRDRMKELGALAETASIDTAGHITRYTVGRERERGILHQAFTDAAAGHSSLVSVTGEPGIGKTTTVEEFLVGLRSTGRAHIARGRCSERLAGSEAYLPILEMLESCMTASDHAGACDVMAQVAPTWFAQVMPARHPAQVDVGAQLEPRIPSQERLKREFRAFLEHVSRTKPLVIFLDDLHWSDVSTIDLVGYLCTQSESMRLLFLVTYRPTDLLLARHPFATLRLDLAARGLYREVALEFLSRDETARYIDLEYPGHQFPATLADVIHAKTEGSPLFMVDLLRDLRDRQVIVPTDFGWALAQSIPTIERDLPASTRSMIERKIGQLSDDDRQILVGASVQGQTFDSAVVAKALGRDPAEVEDRLDVLDRIHGFVSVVGEHTLPNGAPTMRCRFVHVLYQNALYDSLRATRRRSLNAAVANAMIEFHGDDSQSIASELAVLFEAAGDRERSAGYFLLAAQNTLSVCAFAEAVATAERGIALLSGLPQTQNRNAIELKLQIALGTACIAIQGYATRDVERAYGRARELCRRTGDSSNLASVLFGLFVHYLTVPLHETSLALGDEVLAIADREDNAALRVQGLLMHASTRFWTGDIAIGVPQLEEAIALYDYHRSTIGGKTPLFDHGVGCRRYQAASLWLFGFPQKAGRRIEEAIADARSLKDPVTLSGALGFASMLHYFQREVAATADAAAEAIACAKEYGLGHLLGFAATLHGWAVAQLADLSGSHGWEEGLTEILDSLNVFGAAKAKTFGSIARCLLAETYLVRQRFDEAESALHEGLRLAKETNEGFWEAELHRLLGKLALSQQLDDEAETHFERAIDVARTRLEKSLELRAFVSLYHLVRTRSDIKRTKNVHARLGETYVWFTEGFETAELREAKSLLRAG